jgi:hypothetical protein
VLARAGHRCEFVHVLQLAVWTRRGYPNCKTLNKHYAHGVGKRHAHDHTTGKPPVTNFKRSRKLYRQNRNLDRDGDHIACEKLQAGLPPCGARCGCS